MHIRRCPVCKLALRAHDPGFQIQVQAENVSFVALGAPQGTYSVCHECYQRMYPDYGVKLHVPPPGMDRFGSFYCQVCKTYAREDDPALGDNGWQLRVEPEDLMDPEQEPELKDLLARRADGRRDEWDELVAPENTVTDREIGDWLEARCGARHGILKPCIECRRKLAERVHARLLRKRQLRKGASLNEVLLNPFAV